MEFFKTLQLDSWWKVVLWSGIGLFAAALIFDISIVDRRYMLGLGAGMFFVGISNFAALKTIVIREDHGQWTGQKPIHNKLTRIPLYLGWATMGYFGGRLMLSLL